jgi:ABC-type multidrug transport system fused ATPase/permease subunit
MTEHHAKPHVVGGGGYLALVGQFRAQMTLLAVVSFLGATLEAGFLVLLTTALLALTERTTTIDIPLLGVSTSLATALLLAAVAIVCRLVLALFGIRLSADLAAEVTTDVRRQLSDAYLNAGWAVQKAEPAGRLQELLTSFVSRVTTAMTAITQGVTASLSLTAFLAMGLYVDPLATLAVIGGLGCLAGVLSQLRRQARKRSGVAAASNLTFAGSIAELAALGQEMQTFGVQHEFRSKIDSLSAHATDVGRRVQIVSSALSPVYTFLAYAVMVAGVAMLATAGYADLAGVGSVLLLMLRSLSYGQQLVNVSGQLAASRPYVEQVRTTIDRYASQLSTEGGQRPSHALPLTVSDLTYEYVPGKPVLRGLDFSLARGEMVGVIGPSGSGKSTLAQVLLGLRDPSSGVVRVDDVDLTTLDRAWLRQHVSFVPQDPHLLTGTVAENIRFFRDGLSDSDLVRAASKANLLVTIEQMPEQFETHLGERGGMLSGGQRQRLAIARALVGRPELLILDEPTSALDGESESLIRDALSATQGETTVVIIAHRMSSLELCDRIMVLEQGVITSFAGPDELLSVSDFYRKAVRG